MNYFFPLLLVSILLFGGCRSSGKSQESDETNISSAQQTSLKLLANERLGEGVKMTSRDNWVLCSKEVGQRQVVFFVYDHDKSEVIYEDMNPVRSVIWDSAHMIKVSPFDRVGDGMDEANDYFIDVRSGKRIINNK